MTEEDLTLTCPHCRGLIGFDDTGETVAIHSETAPLRELGPGEVRGIGGLITVEAQGNANWKQNSYFCDPASGGQKKAPKLQAPAIAGKVNQQLAEAEALQIDDALQDALDNDLSNRAIKTKAPRKPKSKSTKQTKSTES